MLATLCAEFRSLTDEACSPDRALKRASDMQGAHWLCRGRHVVLEILLIGVHRHPWHQRTSIFFGSSRRVLNQCKAETSLWVCLKKR
jgi:hypothetical protein